MMERSVPMFALSMLADRWPHRPGETERTWLERWWERLRLATTARWRVSPLHLRRFVAQVLRDGEAWARLAPEERVRSLAALRRDLRRHGLQDALVSRAFAVIRWQSGQQFGMEHFPTQIKGGYVLLSGFLTEMATGEGKTLTATLAAATAALAGLPVHLVTVNDYLARRDAEQMAPLYRSVGLSTGLVVEGMSPAEKQQAYRSDITYCTSKSLVFDYLRDRIVYGDVYGDRMRPLMMALDYLVGEEAGSLATTVAHGVTPTRYPMLRGLHFAIVDEVDSVFIDEARTPLIISAVRPDTQQESFFRQALELAQQLDADTDFTLGDSGRQPVLTERGRARLAELCASLSGPVSPIWQGVHRREEGVALALLALHGFERDVHFIVRDDKVMIVDETTGRIMPDRSWERGLQQMIEIREGVPVTPEKETLARISFQLFFRRYRRLSGMTGTVREVAGEVGEVYGLGVVHVAPHRPLRRIRLPDRLYATAEQRWHAVVAAIRDCHLAGQPVLAGTRSIAASEQLSDYLQAAGLPHRVLNAKQDAEEASIVAHAGEPGCITIATNMAGRGTDIKLAPGVAGCGGLHVILTERHDNARVDRQLVGRCARQGDPGSWQAILSLEDELVRHLWPAVHRILSALLQRWSWLVPVRWAGLGYYRLAQWRTERMHRRMRIALLRKDLFIRRSLSFSGEME